jgi:HPt (histidine-containing phosphotransfer) domain-containing protein
MNDQSFQSSGASGGEAPAISEPEFRALVEMVGPDAPEVLADLIDTYLDESAGLVRTIVEGAQKEDLASILRPAHSLKSSSASIGAMRLSRLCADLEAHLRGSLPGLDVPRQIEQIEGEFGRVRSALEAEKVKLGV